MLEFNDIKDLLDVLTQYEILGLRNLGLIRRYLIEPKHGILCLKTKHHCNLDILKMSCQKHNLKPILPY